MTRRGMVVFALLSQQISRQQSRVVQGEPTKRELPTLLATWYGLQFDGNEMANGEEFDMKDPSIAASPTLAFGTKLKVRNRENGRVLEVVIKDRMSRDTPENRIDLSLAGAKLLRFDLEGSTTLEILSQS